MIPGGREGGGGSPISMILGLENTQNGDSLKKADSNGLWWRLQKPKSSDALAQAVLRLELNKRVSES